MTDLSISPARQIARSVARSIADRHGSVAPSFRADLLAAIEPHYSRTGVTPTFTRATTATVTDFEGITRSVKSGESRFQGARRVENLITASEDMTNGAYTSGSGATIDSATEATFDGTAGGFVSQSKTITDDGSGAGGRTFVFTVEVRIVSGTLSSGTNHVSLSGNAITTATQSITATANGTLQRFSVTASTDAAGTTVTAGLRCDNVATLEITKWQLEEVTGQTNQNPSEYVSTGVESSPYHGANVDGVRYFTTHNGNTVSSGVVTAATGPAINSNTSQWVELDRATGTYVSTPDSAAASVTGDITLIAWVAPDDWTPAAAQSVLAKWESTGSELSYKLSITATGTLELRTSADGSAVVASASSVATGFANGTGHWIRVTWNDSGDVANYYTSDDPIGTALDSIIWTQLGTADRTHTSSGIYDGTALVEIGSDQTGSSGNVSGKIGPAYVIASTDPTAAPAVTFNPNRWAAGVTWEDANDEVWTLQGNAVVRGPFSRWGDLPGSSGDYFSTPDSAAGDISSDFTLVMWAAGDDWINAANQTIIGKYTTTGNQRAYQLAVNETGHLNMVFSTDGTYQSGNDINSSELVAFTNGVGYWLRTTVDMTAQTARFFYSEDSPWTPYNKISWTEIGTAQAVAGASVVNSTAVLEIGGINSGTASLFAGTVARAAVIASTDPTVAPSVDFDARAFTPGVSTAVTSTGETWTANGNTSIEGGNFPVAQWDEDGPLGYLSEGARTNIALYSTPGDLGTTWTDTNATPAANYAIAPDGSKTAVRLIDDGATGTGAVTLAQAITITSATATTVSVHAKADQLDWMRILHTGYDTSGSTYFDLANGEVGTVSGNHSDAGIEPVGGGWYRVWIVFQSTTDVAGSIAFAPADADADTTVALDGTSSILVWGAQVEAGSFPSSYIPTEGSAVARNADVLEYDATGIADSFPMTVSAEAVLNQIQSNAFLYTIHDDSASDRIFAANVAGTGIRQEVDSESTIVAQIDADEPLAGVMFTPTLASAENDIEAYLNGSSVGTDAVAPAPVGLATISIGSSHAGAVQPYGTIRNVKIYQRRLNDAKVNSL